LYQIPLHKITLVVIADYLNVICWFHFHGNHVYANWLNQLYFGPLVTYLDYKTSKGISMDLLSALCICPSSCIGFEWFVVVFSNNALGLLLKTIWCAHFNIYILVL